MTVADLCLILDVLITFATLVVKVMRYATSKVHGRGLR